MSQVAQNKSHKKVTQGALVLTLAGLVAKILAAIYRVPFQNLVGNKGFYVYQQIYPFYGVGMTLALSGLPVFVANLLAQVGDRQAGRSLMRKTFILTSVLSLALFAAFYGGAEGISGLMGDTDLTPVIQSLSWMYLFMPFLVLLRGYHQGNFHMLPTALSQVVEQLVRVAWILWVAGSFESGDSYYVMGARAMQSASIAALAALGTLVFFDKPKLFGHPTKLEDRGPSWGDLSKRLLFEGGTLCLLASLLVLFQMVDAFTVFQGLVDQGMSPSQAMDVKGVFDRGQPLVQLGMVLAMSFATGFMPAISYAYAKGQKASYQAACRSLLRMTMAFSASAAFGMVAIMPRLNALLFGDSRDWQVLAVYVLTVIPAAFIVAINGILQAKGIYRPSLVAILLGLGVKWILNPSFVGLWQTMGASLASLVGLSACLGLLLLSQEDISQTLYQDWAFIKKLGMILLPMTLVVGGLSWMSQIWKSAGWSRLWDGLFSLVFVLVGIGLFVILALRLELFTTREWLALPKGKSLLRKTKKWKKETL